jgi:hypothetical protein
MWLPLLPVALQGAAMIVDEGVFHRRRGLPRWERIGHPLDTLTLVACLAWLVATQPARGFALDSYVVLAVVSTLFVTKDEGVHAKLCTAGEHWLHSILFALHPIVLGSFAWLWWTGHSSILSAQLVATSAFLIYQVVYWNTTMIRMMK